VRCWTFQVLGVPKAPTRGPGGGGNPSRGDELPTLGGVSPLPATAGRAPGYPTAVAQVGRDVDAQPAAIGASLNGSRRDKSTWDDAAWFAARPRRWASFI